ncbi:hypothetical protein Ancab_016324 [Ancistrocladus abbreviatus]
MVQWRDDQWGWEFKWCRELRYREGSLVRELLSWLAGVSLSKLTEDYWRWLHSNKGAYTVKSAYQMLSTYSMGSDMEAWKLVWCRIFPLRGFQCLLAVFAFSAVAAVAAVF